MIGPQEIGQLLRGRAPGQLVIQFTDHCNARCPQCGMNIGNRFDRTRLSSDDIKRTIDAAVRLGIKVISFTGGEPLLFLDDLCEYIHYAGRAGMEFIRTGTNGFVFAHPEKQGYESRIQRIADQLAGAPVRNFWISIDSAVPEVHEKMRGFPGLIKGVEKALPYFHERGLYPSANLGINRNIGGENDIPALNPGDSGSGNHLQAFHHYFKDAFRRFYGFVISLGFTMVNTCYPMSIDGGEEADLNAVYAATSRDDVIRFSKAEKALLFKALMETIPDYRSRVRVFSPLTSLYALYKQYSRGEESPFPCRGGIDFFFMDTRDANIYPCGYRGRESFGKLWEMDLDKLNIGKSCHLCDWECFRDPSELLGPMLWGRNHPLAMMKRFMRDRTYRRLWIEDLRYYRAARFFNSRLAPDYRRLSRFTYPTVFLDEAGDPPPVLSVGRIRNHTQA